MPEFCTCGAELPPDALFCHKCGKPQRDIVKVEAPTVFPPRETPMAAPEPARAPVSFHNPVAVRIALLVAITATVLSMTILPILSWPLAGFLAVFFYRRRTGLLLDVGAGARMGVITGLLMAAMSTAITALLWLPAALAGRLGAMMQEQMKHFPGRDPAAMQQMIGSLSTAEMALALVFGLAAISVVITGLSAAGGALGAKLGGRP